MLRLSTGDFQNLPQIFQPEVNRAGDLALIHSLGPGNRRHAPPQDEAGVDAPGLDGREAVNGGIEGGVILGQLHDFLRGQRGPGHVGLEAGGSVQGTLVMLPLAPLVAVTQAAPDGEGHGNLVRHFQGDTLGQAGNGSRGSEHLDTVSRSAARIEKRPHSARLHGRVGATEYYNFRSFG